MNIKTIKKIFIKTATRTVKRQYRYFVLERSRLSEPEIRHVMAKILDEEQIYYGFEYPTLVKHRISGKGRSRSALVDLVLYKEENKKEPIIWVEFKRGQPSIDKISKDFIKMLKERNLEGVCFFHILPKLRLRTEKSKLRAQEAVLTKYSEAYQNIEKSECEKKWFILFISDCESREYYFCQKNDICDIDKLDDGDRGKIEY